MNTQTPDTDIKNIYQKSIRLLSDTQFQLSAVRKVLRKTVERLAFTLRGIDEDLNKVLNKLEQSTERGDVEKIDASLDELQLIINHANLTGKTSFRQQLKSSVDGLEATVAAADYISMIRELVEKQLSDEHTASGLLAIISDVKASAEAQAKEAHQKEVDSFITRLTSSTGFEYSSDEAADELLQGVTVSLSDFISSLEREGAAATAAAGDMTNDGDDQRVIAVLYKIVSSLSLPSEEDRKQQNKLLEALMHPLVSETFWEDVIDKVTYLVNNGVGSLQKKNDDLQAFIVKINKQLVDIKSYIQTAQEDREESVSRSSELQEMVDSNVASIEDKVTTADDLDLLKQDISVYLENIQQVVEENKNTEIEKEAVSARSYDDITKKLNSTEDELAALKSQLLETKQQLLRDTLTGLYNRLAYEDRIQMEMSRSQRSKNPFCIAMWDIDHFKSINDNYGHDVGDRVLKSFARVIEERVRKTDMFARIGGEEFVLLMPDTSAEQALALNDELREIFLKCKFNYNDDVFSVTSSVGISAFTAGDEPEDMLKKADLALYQSKHGGRNRCTVHVSQG